MFEKTQKQLKDIVFPPSYSAFPSILPSTLHLTPSFTCSLNNLLNYILKTKNSFKNIHNFFKRVNQIMMKMSKFSNDFY